MTETIKKANKISLQSAGTAMANCLLAAKEERERYFEEYNKQFEGLSINQRIELFLKK